MPDLGLATFNDMAANAAMIASLDRSVPLIADADTGFGGPLMVARTVEAYIAAGVAGLHLEDQVQNKRCGHLLGKELVDEATYISRIRAAVLAREQMRETRGDAGDIVLIARTDALQSLGFDAALSRLEKAIEAGADVAFLEGFTSTEQGKTACDRLAPTPVLLNMVSGGATPDYSSTEAQDAGFKIIIFPGLMLFAAYNSCMAAAAELKEKGAMQITEEHRKGGPKALFTAVGLLDCIAFDKKAGGMGYINGV
jgi:2-methylisocitrate lyase-like PEP mutase family enzyme